MNNHRAGRKALILGCIGTIAVCLPRAGSNNHPAPIATKQPIVHVWPSRTSLVSDVTFVAFDTETTGFSAKRDRIVEIAAVKFRNGKIIEEKTWLINPKQNIPYWAERVHGISDSMVKDAPTFQQFYPEFEEFIDDCVLMAHNAKFDISFVAQELTREGRELPGNQVIDSLNLFRKWFPDSQSYTLMDLARKADIHAGMPHRAMTDSLYLFLIFNKKISEQQHNMTLHDLYEEAKGPLKF